MVNMERRKAVSMPHKKVPTGMYKAKKDQRPPVRCSSQYLINRFSFADNT